MRSRPDTTQAIDDAARRLLGSVDRLSDVDVRGPSLLPGWTRGHVVAHVAQGADAMRNLLVWARTGSPVDAYASQAARDAAIERGARRSVRALRAELSGSAERFSREVAAMPERGWEQRVRVLDGAEFPAEQLLVRRLVELELHHTDLDTGYGPAHWPFGFTGMSLPEPMRSQRADRVEGDVTKQGPRSFP